MRLFINVFALVSANAEILNPKKKNMIIVDCLH